MSKVKEYQVETIVDTLCTNMLSDKEQLRDISSIGLKTVISELPPPTTGKKISYLHNKQDSFSICQPVQDTTLEPVVLWKILFIPYQV